MALGITRMGPALRTPEKSDDISWEMSYILTFEVLSYRHDLKAFREAFFLPPTLADTALRCADDFVRHSNLHDKWTVYLFMCLALVQGRSHTMAKEEILLRLELESVFMELLYG